MSTFEYRKIPFLDELSIPNQYMLIAAIEIARSHYTTEANKYAQNLEDDANQAEHDKCLMELGHLEQVYEIKSLEMMTPRQAEMILGMVHAIEKDIEKLKPQLEKLTTEL